MSDDEIDWFRIHDDIQRLVERHREDLPSEVYERVDHLNRHDEYEIALEELCLGLIKLSLMSRGSFDECVRLGKILRLDEETVLREDFWQLLMDQGVALDLLQAGAEE